MRLISIIFVIAGVFVSGFAQDTDPEIFKQKEQNRIEQSFANLRKLDDRRGNSRISYIVTFPPPIPAFSKDQIKRLAPKLEDLSKFETFLKTPKTGVIKLFPDLNCESKYLVSAEEICQDIIPRSSFYSFRKGDYSIRDIADIRFKDDVFVSDGELSHGIIVSLGDVSIENINIKSNGVKFLSDYKATKQTIEAANISKELSNGTKDSGYNYGRIAPVKENTTYAIRVIAYRGRLLKRSYGHFYYNIFENDERVDVITVFRVIRKDKDGCLTLVWKELERKNSPKIKISNEDKGKYLIKPL